jgi:hypothetical protein
MELGSKDHGNDDGHAHAALLDLDDRGRADELQRCECGTYAINRERLRELLRAKRPEMTAEWTTTTRGARG